MFLHHLFEASVKCRLQADAAPGYRLALPILLQNFERIPVRVRGNRLLDFLHRLAGGIHPVDDRSGKKDILVFLRGGGEGHTTAERHGDQHNAGANRNLPSTTSPEAALRASGAAPSMRWKFLKAGHIPSSCRAFSDLLCHDPRFS